MRPRCNRQAEKLAMRPRCGSVLQLRCNMIRVNYILTNEPAVRPWQGRGFFFQIVARSLSCRRLDGGGIQRSCRGASRPVRKLFRVRRRRVSRTHYLPVSKVSSFTAGICHPQNHSSGDVAAGIRTPFRSVRAASGCTAAPSSPAMNCPPPHCLSSGLNQLHPLHAGMSVLADNDVVVHRNAERRGDIDDRLGHVDVRLRRRRIAGGMVVRQDDGGGR